MANDNEQQPETSEAAADRRRKEQRVRTGFAVGIGSAAIVAALLYANRPKKKD